MAVCWISNIWFQRLSSNDQNDGAATPPCKNKATSQNRNRIQSRSRDRTQGRIRGGMRWRPKLNETPNSIQTNKHKFKRKLANANSNETKNEKCCFGFCHFVFAWRYTGLLMSDFNDFRSNEGAGTPRCKNKGKKSKSKSNPKPKPRSNPRSNPRLYAMASEIECEVETNSN